MDDSDSTSIAECCCLDSCVNVSGVQEIVEEVIGDLLSIRDGLQLQVVEKDGNQTMRACKLAATMVRLQSVDTTLGNAYDLMEYKPEKEEAELESNFGVSVKLEIAEDKLRAAKEKHDNLRKEWYCQNEHISKLSSKICEKERELRHQSVFCTAQGLILSKMLWKLSKVDSFLDLIIMQEKLTLELIQVFAGCLYGFMHTYGNEMPEPSAEEYQYVLCLCGVFSNLATTPDGRFLLISQPICREVYDEIIKILPKVMVPNAENLKWLMLSAIHNIMICKEGEDYAKKNSYLVKSLGECLKPPHPNRIMTLALKIINSLTNKAGNEAYLVHISSNLPIRRLQQLEKSTDSVIIRKHAKQILSSVMQHKPSEKLIGITQLDRSRSACCQSKCTGTNANNQELFTYYIVTHPKKDPRKPPLQDFHSSGESEESSSTLYSSSVDVSRSEIQCSGSSFDILSSFPQRQTLVLPSASSPVSDYVSAQLVERATSTAEARLDPPEKLPKATEAPSEALSENEIQSVQYQLPQSNLSKMFNVSIGDTVLNPRSRNTAVTAFREGLPVGDSANMSVVTVYQISSSRAILFAENSFAPVCTQTSDNEVAVSEESFFQDANADLKLSSSTKQAPSKVDAKTSATCPVPDASYDQGLWYEKLKSPWQNQTCMQVGTNQKILDMPSTSTGLYEFESFHPYIVPVSDKSSGSGMDCKSTPGSRASSSRRSSSKSINNKQGPSFKIHS